MLLFFGSRSNHMLLTVHKSRAGEYIAKISQKTNLCGQSYGLLKIRDLSEGKLSFCGSNCHSIGSFYIEFQFPFCRRCCYSAMKKKKRGGSQSNSFIEGAIGCFHVGEAKANFYKKGGAKRILFHEGHGSLHDVRVRKNKYFFHS